MNLISKQKWTKGKAFLIALFCVFLFSIFFTKEVRADFSCQCFDDKEVVKKEFNFPSPGKFNATSAEIASCNQQCIASGFVKGYPQWTLNQGLKKMDDAVKPPSVGEAISNIFVAGMKILIFGIFVVFGWLLAASAALFGWIADPKNIIFFLDSQSVREVWVMVRDFLNMFFILVLLFAAFCTIFQVDKWSLKKVWLNVLINALLVNFSFPIARFIIDIANVIMYYFLNNMFQGLSGGTTGASIFTMFFSNSGITGIFLPEKVNTYPISALVASTIFIFILAITFVVLAFLFVIRLVALTVIIMFSPIGFVGYIFPSTSKFADDWWNNLFKYAFFGPIMVFMMMVAMQIMKTMNTNTNSAISGMAAQARAQTADMGDANLIASMAFFSIPIIILWIGMAISQKMGIAGAGMIVGQGQKFGKWAGSTAWHATGIPGGVKQTAAYYGKRGVKLPGFKNRHFGSDQTDAANSWVAQHIGRVPNAHDNDLIKKMGEASKDHNMEDMSKDNLNKLVASGSASERLAATEQLAKNGSISDTQLANVMNAYGKDSAISKRMLGKVKEKSPHLALKYMTDKNGSVDKDAQDKLVKGFKAENLTEDILKDAAFMKMFVATGKMDKKALDGLTNKEKTEYTKTIEGLAGSLGASSTDMNNPEVKNIQTQHFIMTGNMHSSIGSTMDAKQKAARKQIWSSIDKDSASKLTGAAIGSYCDEIAENINRGKLGEIVKAMKNEGEAKLLLRTMINNHPDTKKIIAKDPYLARLAA